MAEDQTKTTIDYDEPGDQVVFIDGASGISVVNGVVRFNFYQTVLNSNPSVGETTTTNVVACRVAMPLETFHRVGVWMTDNVKRMIDQGIVEIAPLSEEAQADDPTP
jgi:hypothetical protein